MSCTRILVPLYTGAIELAASNNNSITKGEMCVIISTGLTAILRRLNHDKEMTHTQKTVKANTNECTRWQQETAQRK